MNFNFKTDPRFSKISPEKLDLLAEMTSQVPNTNEADIASFLMNANQLAIKKGLQFTDAETEILIQAFYETMSPIERKRFELIQKMMKKLQKRS